VAHAFKIFGMWQPVFFKGSHGIAERALGEWTLSGIFNWHTGFPWNPVYNANTSGSALYYNGSGYNQIRPAAYIGGIHVDNSNSAFQQAVNPNYGGNGTTYFTPSTFEVGPAFPGTAAPPIPGIHRNSLNGPNYSDLDASLSKGFGLPSFHILGENARIEVRVDTYNLLNKLNLDTSSIDNTLGSVNPDSTIQSANGDFGVARRALGSRTMQFQARFSF
jgi:hypothetical protein